MFASRVNQTWKTSVYNQENKARGEKEKRGTLCVGVVGERKSEALSSLRGQRAWFFVVVLVACRRIATDVNNAPSSSSHPNPSLNLEFSMDDYNDDRVSSVESFRGSTAFGETGDDAAI